MEEVNDILLGVLSIVFGMLIFHRSHRLSELLQSGYRQINKAYDTKASQAKGIGKLFVFLLFKPQTYYYNQKTVRGIFLLVSLSLMILGMVLILIGLGFN